MKHALGKGTKGINQLINICLQLIRAELKGKLCWVIAFNCALARE